MIPSHYGSYLRISATECQYLWCYASIGKLRYYLKDKREKNNWWATKTKQDNLKKWIPRQIQDAITDIWQPLDSQAKSFYY